MKKMKEKCCRAFIYSVITGNILVDECFKDYEKAREWLSERYYVLENENWEPMIEVNFDVHKKENDDE